jgi:lactoylglutathione lyase
VKIDHIAIWTFDLERLKTFYEKYFGGEAGNKYHNAQKGFESYFLSFGNGCRLEIMKKPGIHKSPNNTNEEYSGLIHFAIAVGSRNAVDDLTNQIRNDGYIIIGEPRTTGDGYYESVILDPDGNRIEITI